MALFEPAYLLERKHEGYYVNNPADKGGETYAGIARKIYPNEPIWSVVDSYKASLGRPLKTNEGVPNTEPLVKAFYERLWIANNFGKIKDQNTANILYDWFINSGYLAFKTNAPETFGVQEILNRDFKKSLTLDGRLGPDSVAAINSVDNAKLYNTIKKERINFYKNLVAKNPSQSVFLAGWLKRINSFADLKLITGAGLLIVLIVAVYLISKI